MKLPGYKVLAAAGTLGAVLVAVAFYVSSERVTTVDRGQQQIEQEQEQIAQLALENCLAIENLKAVIRPEPFDESETRGILTDLSIDPDSEKGQRLLRNARMDRERERAELAPAEC